MVPKESGKLSLDMEALAEFWQNTTQTGWLNPNHPGRFGANVVGLYGDDVHQVWREIDLRSVERIAPGTSQYFNLFRNIAMLSF